MSLPKTNVVTAERIYKVKEFLDKLIQEYEHRGEVDEHTLNRLKEMRQNFSLGKEA